MLNYQTVPLGTSIATPIYSNWVQDAAPFGPRKSDILLATQRNGRSKALDLTRKRPVSLKDGEFFKQQNRKDS